MNTEILNNNLEITSSAEQTALNIMNDMFGDKVVEQAQSLSTVWSTAIAQTDWSQVGIYGGIGAAVGFATGILLTKIAREMDRQSNSPEINPKYDPDPANGCGCTIMSVTTAAGFVAGALVGYYTQAR